MPERHVLPVLPLRDTVLFPGITAPVMVARPKTLRAVELALRSDGEDKRLFAVAQKDGGDDPGPDALYAMGTVARIVQVQRFPGGLQLVLECERRATAARFSELDGVIRAVVLEVEEFPEAISEELLQALFLEARDRALEYGRHRGAPEEILRQFIGNIQEPGTLADHVAFYLDLATSEKQELLETLSRERRLRRVVVHLHRQIGIVEAQERIRTKVQEEIGERQREMYLREQLKAILKELGEEDSAKTRDELETRLESLGLPEEALAEVRRDLGRLKRMGRESAEAQVLGAWLEWIVELPWSSRTDDQLDLGTARRILDEDHHGLEDVKTRVLEFLAVRQLIAQKAEGAEDRARAVSRGPILLFLGPPGTGKTSIAQSVARALGRRYIRVSLGGARDEADIRGHRRTYVGAMPGRILQGMRRGGSRNPVFALDEIDKLGVSFQGDPAAALLEVLDPAQNHAFVDHYLGIPFDLSEVLFICTGNFREGVPPPLFDRMETIEFAGYTEAEKIEIAKKYLLPRQRLDSGLDEGQLIVTDDALRRVVSGYTREAGVRQLERELAALARKTARRIAAREMDNQLVATEGEVRELLGRPRVHPEARLEHDEPGVATGMYYTQMGGDIMLVEASVTPGRGELVLTGHLGEIMRESARAALTYARARAQRFGAEASALVDREYHLHVPAGAVPKDGPSAGVTMATALLSAMTGRPVRSDVAMSGEITLRGRVLPIGGIKEKVLGAHRAGIPEIVLPRANEADLDDLPEEVRAGLRIELVQHLDEVLDLALLPREEEVNGQREQLPADTSLHAPVD